MLGIVAVLVLALVVAILIITTLDKELRTLRNAYNALLVQQVKPAAAPKPVGTQPVVTAEEITKRTPVIRGHRSWVDVKARLENPFDKEAERSARVERHLSEGA